MKLLGSCGFGEIEPFAVLMWLRCDDRNGRLNSRRRCGGQKVTGNAVERCLSLAEPIVEHAAVNQIDLDVRILNSLRR